ncbi:MAG: DUF1868 domain-containing protein [Clostridia bacterium]|nr:DUF1868 domain-containing protein [Clostridia bacterium]
MAYGSCVGSKFYEDGRVRAFHGNTVVADITPDCSAYNAMCTLRRMVLDAGLDDYYIQLPADSYHMTLIQGINDQNRGPDRWPPALALDATMKEADDYFTAAIERAVLPGKVRMKFSEVKATKSCILARLIPADESQEKLLRDFRDRAAREIGLFIPKHETYRFHISLAYTRVVPEGETAERLEALVAKMNDFLETQPEFLIGEPYIAYFRDMFAFSPERIER